MHRLGGLDSLSSIERDRLGILWAETGRARSAAMRDWRDG
jgi:hypothetical protein